MGLLMIARILDRKTEVGYRLLDTKTSSVFEVSREGMLEHIKGKNKVLNVKHASGKYTGTNGTLDRYAVLDTEHNLVGDKKPCVVVAKVGDVGYDIADYAGVVTRLSNAEAVEYAEEFGLANGKLLTMDGKKVIRAVSGSYPIVKPEKTVQKAVVQESEVVEALEPEVFEPEAIEPEAIEPEAIEPEVLEREVLEPEVFEPDVFEPEVLEPEVFEPDVFEPDVLEPEVFEPDVFEPEAVEPIAVASDDLFAADFVDETDIYGKPYAGVAVNVGGVTYLVLAGTQEGYTLLTENTVLQGQLLETIANSVNEVGTTLAGYWVSSLAEEDFDVLEVTPESEPIVEENLEDYSLLENCFTAEIIDHGVVLHVKPDVPPEALKKFVGFKGNESKFKYIGSFERYGTHSMEVHHSDGKNWLYRWGTSKTIISDEMWARNTEILAVIEILTGKVVFS